MSELQQEEQLVTFLDAFRGLMSNQSGTVIIVKTASKALFQERIIRFNKEVFGWSDRYGEWIEYSRDINRILSESESIETDKRWKVCKNNDVLNLI